MSRHISVTIAQDGSVQIEASGFTGKACMDATKPLEDWLGGQVGPRTIKPEYNALTAARTVANKGGA